MPLQGQTQTNGKSHHYSTRVSLGTHKIIDATCKLTGWTARQFLDHFVPAAESNRLGHVMAGKTLQSAIEEAAADNNARQRNLALTRIVKTRKDQRRAKAATKAQARKPRPEANTAKRNKRRGRQAVARRRNAP